METPQPPKFTFQRLWKGVLGTPLPWPSGGALLGWPAPGGGPVGSPDMRPPSLSPTHMGQREGGFLQEKKEKH